MGLEAAEFIDELVVSNPTATDPKSQGDDHLRVIKKALQQSFPNISGEVSATDLEIDSWEARIAALEASLITAEANIDLLELSQMSFAYGNFNGDAGTIIRSSGHWAISKQGTGLYTLTWNVAQDNSNYGVAVTGQDNSVTNSRIDLADPDTTAIRVRSYETNNGGNNDNQFQVVAFKYGAPFNI